MYRIIFIFISAFVLSLPIRAQDAHLSMYDAAPMFLNPALTGVVDADFRLHGHYRTQWKAVNYKPYTTFLLSYDMPFKKWGVGIQLNQFRAGIGNYNSFQGLVSVAYNTPIDKKKSHMLSFGVQAGGNHKSIEFPLLSFDNQYSYENGGYFDETVSSGEDFEGRSILLPSTNAGVIYYYAKQSSRLNPFIGVSAFNLIKPKESFTDMDNRLPLRFYGHVGTRVNLTETLYLIPKVLYMHQEKFSEVTFAVDAGYYFKSNEFYLLGGVVYRNKDAAIFSIGGKFDHFILKVAYDVNVSTLSKTSTGRGGFELSLTYTHKKREHSDFEKICPRL